jgi:DNA mismatch repair protein MSH3
MAAKLQEELSEREEKKLLRLTDKPAGNLLCESSTEGGLVCAQSYKGLMEACRRVLREMASAQSSNDLTNALSSLKRAKEVALKMIKG